MSTGKGIIASAFFEPPAGGLILSDNFNRSDAASLGANWTSASSWSIVSNQASKSGTDDYTVYTTTLGTPDHWSEFQLTASNAGAYLVVNARRPSGTDNTTNATGYLFFVDPGSFAPTIGNSIGGSYSTLITGTALGGWPASGVIRIEVSGTTIRGLVNNVQVVSTTDSSITTGNFAGFNCNFNVVDNWRAGTLPWTP